MGIILWIIFGALAGWIASVINKTDGQQGWIGNIVMGIVGALLGGFIWGLISDDGFDAGFNIGSLLVAIGGALLLSFIMGKATGRRAL
jgi:uncharacterized membrane protein YeaQ/YmgE (transglycosylase-associated protein family)